MDYVCLPLDPSVYGLTVSGAVLDAVAAEIPVGTSPSGIAVTPDGRHLLAADRDDDALSLVDAATRQRIAVIPVGTRPFGVTIDAAGQRAYTANVGSNDVSSEWASSYGFPLP